MAKSIEDNTINRVLESYIMFFQHDHRQLEQAAEVEVEDQGVLMAIGMHGLQEQQHQQQNQADNNELSAELNELHEQLFNNPSPEPPQQQPTAMHAEDTTHNDFMEAAVLSAIQKKGIGLTR
jgi:hypothetical protein